jgi:riboflavin biosynthesis pyrimidine reductase
MAVLGGPRLAQAFLERDLVDEMMFQILPSVVGRGRPFFRIAANPDNPEDRIPIGAPGRHDFKPQEATLRPDGTVFLRYRRTR